VVVFVDHACDHRASPDGSPADAFGCARSRRGSGVRGPLSPRLVRAVEVIVDQVLAEYRGQMTFDAAHQPKELVILPGGHFDAYTKGFEASSGQARDWFSRHLAA
jgi:hypothetical protein